MDVSGSYKEAHRLDFHNALITSVEMPACDAGSKDPGFMTVSITPEITRFATVDITGHLGVYTSSVPKAWHIHDFKLTIDGLERDCAHVKAIGPLRLGQRITKEPVGNMRIESKEPTATEFSDLIVTLAGNSATGFQDWMQDFVVKGMSGVANEKNGLVEFFAPSLTKAYFEVKLIGLGLYKMGALKAVNPKTPLPVDFTMYCNEMTFNAGAASVM